MSHRLPGFVREAGCDQLIIAPYRAVEEHERRARNPRPQLVGHLSAGRQKIEIPGRRLVGNAKAQSVPNAIFNTLALQIPGALARDREGQNFDSAARSIGKHRLEGLVNLDCLPLDVSFAQHVEDTVRLQRLENLGMRIDGKRRALAHGQQSGNGVDLAIGQDHARDRRVTKLAPGGMQLWRRDQLLAQVRRRVDQKPVMIVRADRQRRLGASELGMLSSCGLAYPTAAIPLRNATTCCGAQDDDAQHDSSPGRLARETFSDWDFQAPKSQELGHFPKNFEGGRKRTALPFGNVSTWQSTLIRMKLSRPAYLRAAQAYILISMPTGTSTIFGAFQAILALLGQNRTNSALAIS